MVVCLVWLAGKLPQPVDYAPTCKAGHNGSQNADPALPSCNPEISQQVDALQSSHFTQHGSKRGEQPQPHSKTAQLDIQGCNNICLPLRRLE